MLGVPKDNARGPEIAITPATSSNGDRVLIEIGPPLPKILIDLEVCSGTDQPTKTKIELPDNHWLTIIHDTAQRLYGHSGCPEKSSIILSKHGSETGIKEYPLRKPDLENAMEVYRSEGFALFTIRIWYPTPPRLEETNTKQDLRAQLVTQRIVDPTFIPIGRIRKVLSADNIRRLCQGDEALKTRMNEDPDFVYKVSREGFKLLASFLLADIPEFGKHFLIYWDDEFRDHKMPFERDDFPFNTETRTRDNVYSWQWTVCAMEFFPLNGESPPRKYPQETVMPILKEVKLGSGGFGAVSAIKIEKSHQHIYSLPDEDNPSVALKLFTRERSLEDYTKESSILIQLATLKHPYLIRLLTAFQHGDKCYAVFPLAQGTLKSCMTENHSSDRRYLIWMLSQLRGIAQGLEKIHCYNALPKNTKEDSSPTEREVEEGRPGFHHDMKPENLLIFLKPPLPEENDIQQLEKEYGRMQISDFGLSKIRDGLQGSHTYTLRGTPTYAAPESRSSPGRPDQLLGVKAHSRPYQSRAYDIWSFGCILLEIMAWLLHGPKGVKRFEDERKVLKSQEGFDNSIVTGAFFVKKKNGNPELHPMVPRQIDILRQAALDNSQDSPVNLMMDLVVACLEIDPNRRPIAAKVAQSLDTIYKKAERAPSEVHFWKDPEKLRQIVVGTPRNSGSNTWPNGSN